MKSILDTSGLDKLKAELKTLHNKEVDFGYLGDEGTHGPSGLPYGELAWMLEEGTRSPESGYAIPPRPAMKETVSKLRTSKTEFESSFTPLFRDFVYLNDKGGKRLLNTAGNYLTERYQFTMEYWFMVGNMHTKNSDVTKAIKGHDRPYEDTGELIRNATFKIR